MLTRTKKTQTQSFLSSNFVPRPFFLFQCSRLALFCPLTDDNDDSLRGKSVPRFRVNNGGCVDEVRTSDGNRIGLCNSCDAQASRSACLPARPPAGTSWRQMFAASVCQTRTKPPVNLHNVIALCALRVCQPKLWMSNQLFRAPTCTGLVGVRATSRLEPEVRIDFKQSMRESARGWRCARSHKSNWPSR